MRLSQGLQRRSDTVLHPRGETDRLINNSLAGRAESNTVNKVTQSILGALEPPGILAGVLGPILRGWFEPLGRVGRSGVEMEGEQCRSEQSGREAVRLEKAGTLLETQGCGGLYV